MTDMAPSQSILPPMGEAYFRVAEIDLYPHTRTQSKAERVIATVQSRLARPLTIVSCDPYLEGTTKPLYRVKATLILDRVGAYEALSYILEFFRPVAPTWSVTVPSHDLNGTSWELWGRADFPTIVGLHSLLFGAESEDPKATGAA